MDTEEQHWIQKNNIQIQRDNIGYRRTISDTEEQYLYTINDIGHRGTTMDTESQYWIQKNYIKIQRDIIGYRRTTSFTDKQ